MAAKLTISNFKFYAFFMLLISVEVKGKLSENKTNVADPESNNKPIHKMNGATLLFADEIKQILEKYLFGMCPQNFKMLQGGKGKNNVTTLTCDLDPEQQDLAGRLASLALRAHSVSRNDCSRLGTVLANTFGELARTAANRQTINNATNEANKKRKLSKSQKAKLEAKQRTALAVKKKAAARAAAAAVAASTKMTS